MFWNEGGRAFWQVALMWALVTGATRRQGGQEHSYGKSQGGNAQQILDERLARGEIDTQEYRRLREVIAAGDGRRPAGTGSGP